MRWFNELWWGLKKTQPNYDKQIQMFRVWLNKPTDSWITPSFLPSSLSHRGYRPTCSVLVWNSLSSSSVRGRKLSSFSGYSCQPMAFSNLGKQQSAAELPVWGGVCVCVCMSVSLTGAQPPGSLTGVQCRSHWASRTDRSRGSLPRCRPWAPGCCFHPEIVHTPREKIRFRCWGKNSPTRWKWPQRWPAGCS